MCKIESIKNAMLTSSLSFMQKYFKLLILCLIIGLTQGCRIYQQPTDIDRAVASDENDIKITMSNGRKFIYEAIEIRDGKYFGIDFQDGEKVEVLLDEENIETVQIRNSKASTSSNILGIGIAALSIFSLALMF